MTLKARATLYALLFVLFCLAATIASAQTLINVGPLLPTTRMAWEVIGPSTPAAAQALLPRMRADGSGPIAVADVQCSAVNPPVANESTCSAIVPEAIRAIVNAPGSHTVSLRLYDPATMVETPDGVPFRMTMPAACLDGAKSYAVGEAIGERNQLSTLNEARRMAALELAGFRVREHREQYKDPSTPTFSDGGYWWITGKCVGIPQ